MTNPHTGTDGAADTEPTPRGGNPHGTASETDGEGADRSGGAVARFPGDDAPEGSVEAPVGLGEAGRGMWAEVTSVYVLTAPERRLLGQACRTLDVLAELDTVVEAEGVTAEGSKGQTVTHPAVSEARQQRLALGRLLAQLALPDPEGQTIRSPAQVAAHAAAQARWRLERRGGVA
jgi:hypothetical protein